MTVSDLEILAFWLWVINYPLADAPYKAQPILRHLDDDFSYAQRVAAHVIEGYAPVGVCETHDQLRSMAMWALGRMK